MSKDEIEYPDTTYVRDIEDKVFQALVMRCIGEVEGVAMVGGNLLDNFLGRGSSETIRGIEINQDAKAHSVGIKMEVKVAYGYSLPKKCEELQAKVAETITEYTGLHVSCVHVIFKGILPPVSLETEPPE